MAKPLRVLIVEDSEEDAILLTRELGRGGYDPTWLRVDTPETMTEAVSAQRWDLVVADYTMPNFSGTRALELWKKSGLDAPFIFVSGTLGEDTAVAAMKSGAQDYIMKDNLKRLLPAIERELAEAAERKERKRAEERIRRQQEQIRALYEMNLALTSTLDLGSVLELLFAKIDSVFSVPVAATVRLHDRNTRELEPVACSHIDEMEWKENGWKSARSVSQLVFETNSPMIIRNLETNPGVENKEFSRKHGLVSFVGLPMVAKDERLGVLGIYTKGAHAFTVEEIEFLSSLAGQAALAIHNSQLYEQIKKQAEELQKANRAKTEFLGVMSHELRTPISAIIGYTGMIQERALGAINSEQDRTLKRVTWHANELLALMNTILEASRMEVEEVKAEMHEVNLRRFLDELRLAYTFPLDRDLTLIWDYPPVLPVIKTDSRKLRHILQNLINNAIKFTPKGQVSVSARIREVPRPRERGAKPVQFVEFKVADTGIGIPKEALSAIFDKFQQVDASGSRSHSGVGLGLYIVKKFTELLGGKVEVVSQLGKGSTFVVTILCES